MSRNASKSISSVTRAALQGAVFVLAAIGCSSGQSKGTSALGHSCPEGDPDCHPAGEACGTDSECVSGNCSSGVCALADCEGSGCGQLGGGGTFSDTIFTDDLGTGQGGTDSSCVELAVEFERVTPTVMLLIDQSGSMTQPFDDGKDRWETLRDTLGDPDTSLLNKLDSSVRFGMALYTSNGGFGGGRRPRLCPILNQVDIGLDTFPAMAGMLSDNGPRGDTPTAESLEAISDQLLAFGEEGPKSIILATDGDPDTCEDPDANDDEGSKERSVTAVTEAFSRGIATHVISVGTEVTESHLEALAVAGAGGDESAEAYTAIDTTGLIDAFNEIIGSVRTCDFTLEGTVQPAHASRGTVVLDGRPLTYGDPNGWDMPDEGTVRLLGQACEQVQADATGIDMSFPCDAIRLIPR